LVSVTIKEKHIQERKQTIVKNSKEEKKFIKELREIISNINISNIFNSEVLKGITQDVTKFAEKL